MSDPYLDRMRDEGRMIDEYAASLRQEEQKVEGSKKLANDIQYGGNHYKGTQIQHWDFAAANGLDYFQGCITKYVTRWRLKNGLEDLKKAQHFLQKYIELVESGIIPIPPK